MPEAPEANRLALRRARLVWEIETLEAAMPADVTVELEANRKTMRLLEGDRDDLAAGAGRWAGTEVGQAHTELSRYAGLRRQVETALDSGPGLFERRRLPAELGPARAAEEVALLRSEALIEPHRVRLEAERAAVAPKLQALETTRWQSRLWLQAHPEAGSRLAHLRREVAEVEHRIENRRRDLEGMEPCLSATERILATPAPHRTAPEPPVPVRSRGMSLHR